MKKVLISLAAVSLFALGGQAIAADHQVKMLNNGADGMMVFEPGYLKVDPGDSITFVPTDAGHDSVAAHVPDGAKTWAGAMGQPVTVKLDVPGVYIYKCEPHLPLGMVGVIQVGAAGNLAQATQAGEKLTASMAMNKPRLAGYLAKVK